MIHQQGPMLRRDAIAGYPRSYREDRGVGEFGYGVDAGSFDDVGMAAHSDVMHYALQERKRHLHNESQYARRMADPAERLRIARLRAGFSTGKEAAEALGFPVSTYLSHENGSRGYPAKKAFTYARKFKVREQWLLYGVGPGPGETEGEKAEVVDIFDRLPPMQRAEAIGYLRGLAGGKRD